MGQWLAKLSIQELGPQYVNPILWPSPKFNSFAEIPDLKQTNTLQGIMGLFRPIPPAQPLMTLFPCHFHLPCQISSSFIILDIN
jgi:hypothetical protein